MAIWSFFEHHSPNALQKYADGCESIAIELWHVILLTTTSSILCIAISIIGIRSIISIIRNNNNRKKPKRYYHKNGSNDSKSTSITNSNSVSHSEPLLMDSDNPLNLHNNYYYNHQSNRTTIDTIDTSNPSKHRHSLLCNISFCQCSSIYLINTRNLLSIVAIIGFIIAAWMQMLELLMCQLAAIEEYFFNVQLGYVLVYVTTQYIILIFIDPKK